MYLEENTVFDNRYRLVQLLGQGASAQVWLAEDTLTNNLKVAIKIFAAQETEMDSYGQQDFQNEFTTVYNINHQNLLTPTNYSVHQGVPYLVLPYCENGSVSSMIGRCEEHDIVKLIHDVATGLEYLHQHNVIHQDIKPDNIMLDDDLNYLVSDFGISTGRDSASETYGGTRAYMAPERFNGVSDSKGDVWALGATAYEMLTGNAPFGDHGGLVQAQGEPVPPIDVPGLSPDLLKLIYSMLDPDPAKRPTPEQIRRTTARVLETGSWKENKGNKRTLKVGAIVLGLVIVLAGFFVWGMLRTKTYYYRDYVEVNGTPIGIGSLTGSEHRARHTSYRIQTRGGKVTRVSLVNSKGKIVDDPDAENVGLRFPDQEYFYGSNDRVDHMIARNSHGKVLYKFTYSDKGNTVSFQYDDEKNSPKFFDGTSPVTKIPTGSDNLSSSNIAHMFLEYDDNGRLIERQNLSLLKQPTPDLNGIYGERYKYDADGRVTEVTFIDRDGNPVGDTNGTAISRYKYDDEGNRIEVAFFAPDGNPSHQGYNIHRARLTYDEVGNIVTEMYFNGDDEPVASGKSGAFGYKYVYDHGFLTKVTMLDADGNAMFGKDGYSILTYESDGNGFNAVVRMCDEDGNPVTGIYEGVQTSAISTKFTDDGLPTEIKILDEDMEPADNIDNISRSVLAYNEVGDIEKEENFRIDGSAATLGGTATAVTYEYDNLGRIVSMNYLDSDGEPAFNGRGVSSTAYTYSPYGSVQTISMLDLNRRPVNDRDGCATIKFSYDDKGRPVEQAYYNASNNLVKVKDFARRVVAYDPSNQRVSLLQNYGADNRLLSTVHYTYDNRGRLATQWTTGADGQLQGGTAKEHFTYNDMGKQTSVKHTDLADRRVNVPLLQNLRAGRRVTCSEIRYVYDANGNLTETSYWDASGKPAAAADGAHRRISEFDNRGRVIKSRSLTTAGSPVTNSDVAPEIHIVYDNRNNVLEYAAFDGYGRPVMNKMDYHRRAMTYDNHNNVTSEAFYGTDGKPVNVNHLHNSARHTMTYDDRNNNVAEQFFTADGRLLMNVKSQYNDKNTMTRQEIFDSAGNLTDGPDGFAIVEIKVSDDGFTPLSARRLNKSKQLVATGTWDKEADRWDFNSAPGESSTGGPEPQWMAAVKKQAASCPREIMDGMVMRSITATPTSVTITIALKTVSGNNYNRSEVSEIGDDYAEFPHNYLGVPGSVACHVRVLNRENKVIYSR